MVGGFGKTQARVDEYFALKKIEADWASERARPASLKGSRPAGQPKGLQAGRPGLFLAPLGSIFSVRVLLLIPHLSLVVTMRRNISENVQFPAKIQHAPKSRTISKTVKFGCQVVG